MAPILNTLHEGLKNFIEEHIVDIPDEKKEAFRQKGADLIAKLVEAGAKGAAEGIAEKAHDHAA